MITCECVTPVSASTSSRTSRASQECVAHATNTPLSNSANHYHRLLVSRDDYRPRSCCVGYAGWDQGGHVAVTQKQLASMRSALRAIDDNPLNPRGENVLPNQAPVHSIDILQNTAHYKGVADWGANDDLGGVFVTSSGEGVHHVVPTFPENSWASGAWVSELKLGRGGGCW